MHGNFLKPPSVCGTVINTLLPPKSTALTRTVKPSWCARITEPLLEGCCLRLAVPRHVRHPCGRRESLYHRPASGRAFHSRRSGISEHLWPRCQPLGKDRGQHYLHGHDSRQLHGHPHAAGAAPAKAGGRKLYVLKYIESGELHYELDAQYCKPFSQAWKTYL